MFLDDPLDFRGSACSAKQVASVADQLGMTLAMLLSKMAQGGARLALGSTKTECIASPELNVCMKQADADKAP